MNILHTFPSVEIESPMPLFDIEFYRAHAIKLAELLKDCKREEEKVAIKFRMADVAGKIIELRE